MPENYSKYEITGNKALDIVSQAVGWAQTFGKPLKSVTLSRTYYAMFWAGFEILRKEPLPEEHVLMFENVMVLQGSSTQIDNITLQYYEKVKALA